MELEGKTVLFLAAPFIVMGLLISAAFYIPFEKGLTDAESGMLDFIQADISIRKTDPVFPLKGGPGPFEFSAGSDGKEAEAAGRQNGSHGLSLIVVSDRKKMAMIDGRLVKEGDRIDDKKITKIEPDRILVRDRTLKWEYMKEER